MAASNNSFTADYGLIVNGNLLVANGGNVNVVSTNFNVTTTGSTTLNSTVIMNTNNFFQIGVGNTFTRVTDNQFFSRDSNNYQSVINSIVGYFQSNNANVDYTAVFPGVLIFGNSSGQQASLSGFNYSGTAQFANNATKFGGQLPAYYANVTSPSFTTSLTVGNVSVNTSTVQVNGGAQASAFFQAGGETINNLLPNVLDTVRTFQTFNSVVAQPNGASTIDFVNFQAVQFGTAGSNTSSWRWYRTIGSNSSSFIQFGPGSGNGSGTAMTLGYNNNPYITVYENGNLAFSGNPGILGQLNWNSTFYGQLGVVQTTNATPSVVAVFDPASQRQTQIQPNLINFTANGQLGFQASINSTIYTGTANNANFLGGLTAAQVGLPTGSIIMWYGNTATVPVGFGVCDGSIYTHANGTGTIASPNLMNRFVLGAANSTANASVANPAGTVGGSFSVMLNLQNIPSHTHGVNDPSHTHNSFDNGHAHTQSGFVGQSVSGFFQAGDIGGVSAICFNGVGGWGTAISGASFNNQPGWTGISIANSGGGPVQAAVNTTPPFVALLYLIKL